MASSRSPSQGFDPTRAQGHDACSENDCPSLLAYPCQYVDRRGRACTTSWCVAHRWVAEDDVFCPRHAGLVHAFGSRASADRPDLDSRAASLAEWMGRNLDGDLRLLLSNLPDLQDGERLITEPVRLVPGPASRERHWEREWKLINHVAVSTRVTLQVSEQHETDLVVRVNDEVLLTVVPPWISGRTGRGRLSPLEDRLERMQFEQFLIDAIRVAVQESRRRDVEFERRAPVRTAE